MNGTKRVTFNVRKSNFQLYFSGKCILLRGSSVALYLLKESFVPIKSHLDFQWAEKCEGNSGTNLEFSSLVDSWKE